MANEETLSVELTVKDREYLAALKNATDALQSSTAQMAKATDGLATKTQKSTGLMQQAFATFAGFLSGQVVIGAFNSFREGAKEAFDAIVGDGVRASAATEAALNDLNSAMARSGVFSRESSKRFEEFANELQRTTKYSDDAVLSAGALIQSLTQMQSEKGLQGATKAAADLAATLNIDLQSASQMVARAINGNATALEKQGFQLSLSSDRGKNLQAVLQALSSTTGAASAKLNTFDGVTELLKNTWEDFTKIFGDVIVKNPAVINAMSKLAEFIRQLGEVVSKNQDSFRDLVNFLVTNGVQAFTSISKSVLEFVNVINGIRLSAAQSEVERLTQSQEALSASIEAIKKDSAFKLFDAAALGDLEKQLASTNAELDAAKAKVDSLDQSNVRAQQALNGVNGALDALSTGVSTFQAAAEGSDAATAAYERQSASIIAITDAQRQQGEIAKELAAKQNNPQDIEKSNIDSITAAHDAEIMSDEDFFATKEELLNQSIARQQAALDEALATRQINDQTYAAAQNQLTLESNNQQLKLLSDRRKAEQESEQRRLKQTSDFFGNLSTLASSGNKELAAIGKASAIAQATIDGYAAVQKALASAPPPFNFALAAGVGIATAANVAKIASTPLASGIDSVPGIGSKDNFPAMLMPGERVVPAETNQDLTNFLKNGGSQAPVTIHANINVAAGTTREQAASILDALNDLMQANGNRMLGSTV